jgi:hypothetical protein
VISQLQQFHSESLDARGAGDHDQPYPFGWRPRANLPIRSTLTSTPDCSSGAAASRLASAEPTMSFREPTTQAPALPRTRRILARDANGQPRTDRLSPQPAQQVAYRRLVLAILGLDVTTLADELRAGRCLAHALPNAA